MDRSPLYPWVLRAVWAALPFTAGPALAAALDARSPAVQATASIGLWAVWGVALCATLFRHPITLTLVRLVTPLAVLSAAWTALATTGDRPPGANAAAIVVALATTSLAAALSFLPETAMVFVNGPAYANERRYPLRAPGPLLVGPLYLAWALTVVPPIAGALLLAARQWIAGGVLAAIAPAGAFVLGRALHGLSRRWIVFVPAGLVLHDPITLADPVLFSRQTVSSVVLAPKGTTATDLSQRAPGLAIEVALSEPAMLVLTRPGQRIGPTIHTDHLLFTPTRPGRVLADARDRKLA